MSKRKTNGETDLVDDPLGTKQHAIEKRKPQPKMVTDPDTGEPRLERKDEKFKRLAERRMTNALKRLDQIKALSNRSQYDYTDSQVIKVIETLMATVSSIRTAFAGEKPVVRGFRF